MGSTILTLNISPMATLSYVSERQKEKVSE